MAIETLLKKYPRLFSQLFNIYLVYRGGRRATLVDPYKNGRKDLKAVKFLKQVAISYGLLCMEHSSDFFIAAKPGKMIKYIMNREENPDVALGKALGFYCADHTEYYDDSNPRFLLEVYAGTEQIYAEVCEASKVTESELNTFGQQVVQRFTKTLPPKLEMMYPLTYKVLEF